MTAYTKAIILICRLSTQLIAKPVIPLGIGVRFQQVAGSLGRKEQFDNCRQLRLGTACHRETRDTPYATIYPGCLLIITTFSIVARSIDQIDQP